MKLLLKFLILSIVIVSSNSYAGNKIIKWVDKNGVTQYGDRLPMPSKANKASVLSNQGVTLQKIEQKSTNTEQDQALAAQARYDNALLGSYNSTEEIDIARKRNTRIDELALTALQQKLRQLNAQLSENNKVLLSYAKDNKVAPKDKVETAEKNLADIEKTKKQIQDRQEIINAINHRYEKDKVRYAELESRKAKLHDIKYSKKNITDLETWRDEAQKRVEYYEAENLAHKRAGTQSPKRIKDGLLSATKELERANEEINANRLAIKESKAVLSRQ